MYRTKSRERAGNPAFLQLDKIGEMAHIMETVLSALRSGEVKPETEVVNELLAGIDLLNTMLNDVGRSNEFDISDIHGRLTALHKEIESPELQEVTKSDIRLQNGSGDEIGFEINWLKLSPKHAFLHMLKCNLSELSEREYKSPAAFIRELLKYGEIIDANLQTPHGDLSEGLPNGALLYSMLYSTSLNSERITERFGIVTQAREPPSSSEFL